MLDSKDKKPLIRLLDTLKSQKRLIYSAITCSILNKFFDLAPPVLIGISVDVVKTFSPIKPLLGVCLGHQCVGIAFGCEVKEAGEIMHGKMSDILHDGKGVFENIPDPFKAIRYHSLAVVPDSISNDLEVSAKTNNGIIMGVRHKEYPTEGIQFHPESIMTDYGKQILSNFLKLG